MSELIRDSERNSIRAFLASHHDYFAGARVLDYGCGRQPYRGIIERAGGEYHGYDSPAFPASVAPTDTTGDEWPAGPWDVIVCTQVVQYVADVATLLAGFRFALADTHGILLMTGPTNWPVVEAEDLHRFTLAGITRLLRAAGFSEVAGDYRTSVRHSGETWDLGWEIVAQ